MKKKYKTKFPVARIKKIMQMDEDVGKVAQATPVLISKALELFMQSLIDQACQETRARSAKRITVSHLKKTIMTTEQFDFLKDVVANIPDPAESTDVGGGEASSSNATEKAVKNDTDNMDVEEDAVEQPKKRRRRKKNVDDADPAPTASSSGTKTQGTRRRRTKIKKEEPQEPQEPQEEPHEPQEEPHEEE